MSFLFKPNAIKGSISDYKSYNIYYLILPIINLLESRFEAFINFNLSIGSSYLLKLSIITHPKSLVYLCNIYSNNYPFPKNATYYFFIYYTTSALSYSETIIKLKLDLNLLSTAFKC